MAQTVQNMLSSPERVIESSCILMRSTLPFISRFSHPCIFQMQAWLSMQKIPVCSFIPRSYQQERGAAPGPSDLDQAGTGPYQAGPGAATLPSSSWEQFTLHLPHTALLSRGSNHESLNPPVIQSTEGMLNQDLISVSTVLLSSQLR